MGKEKAFIFTLDALLAFIPVFIALGALSNLDSSNSLLYRNYLRNERVAQDALEVMFSAGDIEEYNTTRLNTTLERLVPSYFNYAYELEFNGSTFLNVSRGNVSSAREIAVAKRGGLIQLYAIKAEMYEVAHMGSNATEPCCTAGGGRREYSYTFDVSQEEFNSFQFWFVGEWVSDNVRAWWGIWPQFIDRRYNLCTCAGSKPNDNQFDMTSGNPVYRVALLPVGSYLQVGQNTLYVTVESNGEGNFFIIKSPPNPIDETVTSEAAKIKQLVVATIKVSPSD